jgi:hypothetical protein
LLIYVPFFHIRFSARPTSHGLYWLLPLPFTIGIFAYDEVRKWLLRRDRKGTSWVTRHT